MHSLGFLTDGLTENRAYPAVRWEGISVSQFPEFHTNHINMLKNVKGKSLKNLTFARRGLSFDILEEVRQYIK